jgi:quinol monooxygenase YgiN
MIVSIMELIPTPGKRQAVLEILRFTEDKAQAKAGCMGCGVYEATDERGTILYLERWQSREDLHRHIQSSLYLAILNAMELGQEAPEISFHEVSDTESMELIEALRSPDG